MKIERRDAKGLAIIVIILLFLFDSLIIEPGRLIATSNSFGLLEGDNAFKIVFISDIHAGQERDGYIAEVVGRINALHPDVVLIGGDSIDWSESELPLLEPLAGINASSGVYAVLGNHDYGVWGCGASPALADKVEKKLEEMNITVLRNENRIIQASGARFALIGLDDEWVCRNNYPEAAAGTGGLPKIILAHNTLAVEGESIDGNALVLSGHTHCGLVKVPLITQFFMGPSFGSVLGGRGRLANGAEAYVTCGVLPGGIRFLSNPEISEIYIE